MDAEDEGPDAARHRWLGYDTTSSGRFIAICACGWRSSAYPTAGLAGSAWDAHADAGANDDATS